MIRFKRLFYKNFLSVGRDGIEYLFQDNSICVIHGRNGSGKSVAIDALNYSLYGKAFRKINVPQLVNSINQKELVVEVEFEIGKRHYKIVRGMRPQVFLIWVDGQEVKEDSNNRDFQKFLENQILRMDERTFKQVVVLGSKAYIPFMQLSASHRRTVVEDFLDLGIYAAMKRVLSGKMSELKSEIKNRENALSNKEGNLEWLRNNIKNNTQKGFEEQAFQAKERLKELKQKLQSKKEELAKAKSELQELQSKDWQTALSSAEENLSNLEKQIYALKFREKNYNKELKFYRENDVCGTCHQDIPENFKKNQIASHEKEIQEIQSQHSEKENAVKELRNRIAAAKNQIDSLQRKIQQVYQIEKDISYIKDSIKNDLSLHENLVEKSQKAQNDLEEKERELLDEINVMKDALKEKKKEALVQYEASELLHDNGIKSQIVSAYLPTINKLIRKYLDIMEFNIDFRFDSNFKEEIRSRYRDNFSYGNFSEGQKLRIDLALLFTWREIAKVKNSCATNLLIFDEIGDSSLDLDGFECFMKILKANQEGQCVMVISHTPEKIMSKADRVYEFDLKNNFTHLVSIEKRENENSIL